MVYSRFFGVNIANMRAFLVLLQLHHAEFDVLRYSGDFSGLGHAWTGPLSYHITMATRDPRRIALG